MALFKRQQTGVKFRRQAAIESYIVDFVCFSHGLIVELDGPQHVEESGKKHDARRTEWLTSRGFRVIRFRNQELDENVWQVVDQIKQVLSESPSNPLPSPPRKGEGTERG
jgi:very-short-patch-repair endonuclease